MAARPGVRTAMNTRLKTAQTTAVAMGAMVWAKKISRVSTSAMRVEMILPFRSPVSLAGLRRSISPNIWVRRMASR